MKRKLIQLLHEGNYSCVIENGEIQTFSQRGIVDLYNILNDNKDFLKGAYVADKVIILNLIKDFLNKSKLKTLALVLLGMTFSFGAKGQVKNDSIKKGLPIDEVIVTGTRNKTDIKG